MLLRPIYLVTWKTTNFEWGPEEGSETGPDCFADGSETWTIWSSRSIEVSVSDSDALRSLWQVPIGETQRMSLRIWSNILPSSANNCSPFEKQLLNCYWALMETEGLSMGHEVTMWYELHIMKWVISFPPSHNVGCSQQQFIIKTNLYVHNHAWVGPEA